MPYSFSYYKKELLEWFKTNVPKHKRILDVGPGVGTYADLLTGEGYRIDAVEIFPPYIEKYGLLEKYDNVFIGDIRKFDIKDYDFIILGDVLEHIPKEDAIKLYEKIISTKECLVAVPFEMEQGEHEGNIYETHHQVDLTPTIMKERYPKLKVLKEINDYGYYYYIKSKFNTSMKTHFWTRVDGQLLYRNLAAEEYTFRHEIIPSWCAGKIDEPILIYYEVYDAHSADFIDECIYQFKGCTIQPGDVVVDLGANIGIFTNKASELGASKVYSFEPANENFELLLLNRPSNCEPFKLAIGSEDLQTFNIAYKAESPGGSSLVKYDDGILQPCLTVTLDTLLANGLIEKIDFLKMDIEGAEVMAFNGISDDNLKNIRCISMEAHTPIIREEGVNYIYNRLHGLGFKSFTITQTGGYNQVYFWQNK